jgi:putative phosphoesterase
MRIGIFSDIHGNQYAFHSFIKLLPSLGLDELIFCGDLFGYYYGQAEIIDQLINLKNIHWILGNHDKYFLELVDGRKNISDLEQKYGSSYRRICGKISASVINIINDLPLKKNLTIEGISIEVLHGVPSDILEGRLYPKDDPEKYAPYDADILVMGHTHFRMVKYWNKTLLLNSGSLGQPRDIFPSGIMVLTLPEKRVEFVDVLYDKEMLVREIVLNDPKNKKLIEILFRSKKESGDKNE